MRAIDINYKEEYALYIFVLIIGLFFCYLSLPSYKYSAFALYASTLLLSMLCIYISENAKKKWIGKLFFLFGMAAIGYPMAFRLPDGMDVLRYSEIFEAAKYYKLMSYFKYSEQENGYLLLNWLFSKYIDDNYNHFQVFIVYLTFIMWGLAFRKDSNQKGSGMFMILFLWSHIYFFVLSAGMLRIFLALSMTFIGLHFIWKDQWKWFLFWIILASFIHMSSLLMLLFLVFYYKRRLFYRHWIFFVFLMFFIVLISLFAMAKYLVPILGSKYQGYGNVDSIDITVGSFTTFPIWLACYYYYKNLPVVSVEYKKKYIIGMILISLSIVFSIASTAVHVGRIIYFAYLGFLIVISAIFQIRTRDYTEVLLKCLLIIYPLVYVMITTLTNSRQPRLFPYKSFLFE